MSFRRLTLVLVLLLAGAAAPAARQAGQSKDAPKFTSQTAAVLVDVVVRDRKGAPVLGLTAADFDVLEDGVRQKLISLDAVSAGTPSLNVPNAPNAPNAPNVPNTPSYPSHRKRPDQRPDCGGAGVRLAVRRIALRGLESGARRCSTT
jgi:hypothetical protein